MVERIPEDKRKRIVALWLRLKTYSQISSEVGVSPAAISNVINDELKQAPDLKDVRSLLEFQAENNLSHLDMALGSKVAGWMRDLGIDFEDGEKAIRFYKDSGFGEKAPELVDAGQRMKTLEDVSRTSYDDLIEEFEEKTESVKELSEEEAKLLQSVKELQKKLRHLKELDLLMQKITGRSISIEMLDKIIDDGLRLSKVGLSPSVGEILAKELTKQGIEPQLAANLVVKMLKEASSLEENLSNKTERVNILTSQINQIEAALQRLATTSKGELVELESVRKTYADAVKLVQDTQEDYTKTQKSLEDIYSQKKTDLEKDYSQRKKEIEADLRTAKEGKEEAMKGLEAVYFTIKGHLEDEVKAITAVKDQLGNDLLVRKSIIEKFEKDIIQLISAAESGIKKIKHIDMLMGLIKAPESLNEGPQEVLEPIMSLLSPLETYVTRIEPKITNGPGLKQSLAAFREHVALVVMGRTVKHG